MTSSRTFQAAVPFGRYQLLARLGKGGMGEVFLALVRGELGFNKLVVVKRLLVPEEAIEEDIERAQQMFIDEARLAARLNHPNVVQTNDVGIEDGQHFMTMEYLEGQTLGTLVRRLRKHGNELSLPLALRVGLDLLSGLQYAHELNDFDGTPLGIVHRDLSPHNVFITYEGTLKILDFGVAKASINSQRTERGILKGKFAYMAPEQLTGDDVDRRADVFVAGIVLWELFAQRPLMARENDGLTVTQLLQAPIPPLRSIMPSLSVALEDVVARALERSPEKRYQNARELREALATAAAGEIEDNEVLGKLVSESFASERAEVKARIQECVSRVDSVAPPAPMGSENLPLIRGPSSATEDTSAAKSRPRPLRSEEPTSLLRTRVSSSVSAGSATAPIVGHRRTPLLVAAGIAAVIAALAVGLLVGRHPADATGPVATASTPAHTEAEPTTKPAVTAVALAPAVPSVGPAEEPSAASAHPAVVARVDPGGRRPTATMAPPPPRAAAPSASSAKPDPSAPGRRIFNTKLE